MLRKQIAPIPELENFATKGQGDCAFHASCGEWDETGRQFICKNIQEVRGKVAQAIRVCRNGDPIYPAVREAIQEMIMAGDTQGQKELSAARDVYEAYLNSNKGMIENAWKTFEAFLRMYPDVLTYIKEHIPDSKKELPLRQQFSHCLAEDETLEGIIYSIPDLHQKRVAYNKATNQNFNLDHLLEKRELLNEYANLMARSRKDGRDGYWLLRGELDIVAKVLGITVNLYVKDEITHEKKHTETYNLPSVATPTTRVVNVYFDVKARHYEAMAPKGSYFTKPPFPHSRAKNRDTWLPSLSSPQAVLEGVGEYASSGLKKSLHGNVYQLKLLMLFLKRGVDNRYEFRLGTEVDEAEKFDDVVFKYSPKKKDEREAEWGYRYLQAKHKYEDKSKISDTDLLTEDDDEFSLQKYFISYREIKKRFVDGKLRDFTICTNIGFDFDGDNKSGRVIKFKDALEEVLDEDDILNVSGKKIARRYRFKSEFFGKKELYTVLKGSAAKKLADKLAENIVGNKKLSLQSPIFSIYHRALAKEVLDARTKKIRETFISNDKSLSSAAQNFHHLFFERVDYYKKLKFPKGSKEYNQNVVEFLKSISLDISGTFGKSSTEESVESLPSEENVKDEDISEFFRHLVFAVDQPTEIELGEIIKDEFSEGFNLIDSGFIASHFQEKMLDWMKAKKGTFLTAKQGEEFFSYARHMVDQLVLIGPTLEYCEILNKSSISFERPFDLQVFLSSKTRILNYTSPNSARFSSIKVYQALRGEEVFKKQGSYIFIDLDSCVNLNDRLVSAFRTRNTRLLIIECNDVVEIEGLQAFVEHLQNVLKEFDSKKIILISKGENPLFELFEKKEYCESKQDEDDGFEDLTDASKEALKRKTLIFQGRSVSLGELVPLEGLTQVVRSRTFLELVSQESIVIDCFPAILTDFEASCYIPRTLQRSIYIRKECLSENLSDMFALSGIVDDSELRKIIKSSERIREFGQGENQSEHPSRYILLEQDKEEAQFKELLSTFPGKTIHWLRAAGEEGFSWQMSRGSLDGLRKFVKDDDEEEYGAEEVRGKAIIISAEPGMGKSTSIDYLVEHERMNNPSLWVIKIDLKAQKEFIEMMSFNNMGDVISFLGSVLKLSHFGIVLLEYLLQASDGRVAAYLDGFDEISTDHQVKISQLIQILCRMSKISKVVVTTRLHMQSTLEDRLSVFSYNLKPFSQEDQIKYLRLFWANHLKIKIDSETEIKKFRKFATQLQALFADSTKDKDLNFMGVPLQARLFAEAFQEDFKKYYHGEEESVELPKQLDTVGLYQKFIAQKYKIYLVSKQQVDINLNATHRDLVFKALTKAHQRLAFQVLFDGHMADFFSDKGGSSFTKVDLNSVGIVQLVENRVTFVHRTFSEYFSAAFFLALLKKPSNHPDYLKVKEFLKAHIFKSRNGVIRIFLQNLIAKDEDETLKNSWREICESLIKGDPSKEEDEEKGLQITEYFDEEDDFSKEKEDPVERFDKDFQDVEKFYEWQDKTEVRNFFRSFFKNILKVDDVARLEMGLEKLADIGKKTNFNILKGAILDSVDALIMHYLSQAFASPRDKSIFKVELLQRFCDISGNFGANDMGRLVASNVDAQANEWKKKFSKYKKLHELDKKDIEKDEFWKNLTLEKVLFLRVINYIFPVKSLKSLMSAYPAWESKPVYGKIFKELFFQINEKDVGSVKRFLLKKRDYSLLIKLRDKFQNLHLTNEEIARIYDGEDLLWLERSGISISYNFRKLTPAMVCYFVSPLREKKINGFHTGYAHNIFRQLILPLIDLVRSNASNTVEDIDRRALIDMFAQFSRFSFEHGVVESLNLRQFEAMLSWVEEIFNHPLLYKDMLLIGIRSLADIVISFRLNLVVTHQSLLVLDPINDFSYELNLIRKSHIIPLLRLAIQNDGEDLELECNRTIGRMFPLSATNMLVLQFNHSTSKTQRMNAAASEPFGIRRRSFS